ncbi:YkgJ family cysteine cluster protein [Elusimicrobiota bacterium]
MCNNDTKKEFKCSACGNCCAQEGYVFINKEDIHSISDLLEITTEGFIRKFTRKEGNRMRLHGDYDKSCIFLENNKCAIYTARPKQCKSFPFWYEILKYRNCYEESTDYCESLKNLIL